MRDFSRRTEKIAICRGEWEISRSVAENVKNRDLSRRIGNFAVSYMPRNPFVPVPYRLYSPVSTRVSVLALDLIY